MADMVQQDTRWKTWFSLLLGLGLTFLFFYMMAPFVVAFLLGAVIAIISNPIAEKLKTRNVPSGIAALLVTTGISLGIVAPLGFILFSGSYRLLRLIGNMQNDFSTTGDIWNHPAVLSLFETITRWAPVDIPWIQSQLMVAAQSTIAAVSRLITQTLASMPAFFLGIMVIIISVFFLLKDGRRFLSFLDSLSPIQSDRSRELYLSFERSCRGVVLALFGSAIIQGALMLIFALALRLPNALLIGALTVIMGMVPVVGASPVWAGATVYLFFNHGAGSAIVMLIGGILISTSDNIVRPAIMKGHSEMHPLLALVSVFGAINLVGATGIFLGPIIAAVFVSFLQILASEIRSESIPLPPPSQGLDK